MLDGVEGYALRGIGIYVVLVAFTGASVLCQDEENCQGDAFRAEGKKRTIDHFVGRSTLPHLCSPAFSHGETDTHMGRVIRNDPIELDVPEAKLRQLRAPDNEVRGD